MPYSVARITKNYMLIQVILPSISSIYPVLKLDKAIYKSIRPIRPLPNRRVNVANSGKVIPAMNYRCDCINLPVKSDTHFSGVSRIFVRGGTAAHKFPGLF